MRGRARFSNNSGRAAPLRRMRRLGRPDDPFSTAPLAEVRRHQRLRLLLDYDGTLVPLARSPGLAAPDEELLVLLERLAESPGIEIDIVSGRPHETLERWFGDLPITLWAEHGFGIGRSQVQRGRRPS